MSASTQDFWRSGLGSGMPRKVATGRASSAKSMENLSQPNRSITASAEKSSTTSKVPRIDLTNFDSPEFDSLDYVLTSPRSLEACHRLGVQPVSLLYKRLQDFELENPGLPVAQLFQLYDEFEAKRKLSLKLARQEREKIMAAEASVDDSLLRSSSAASIRKPALSNKVVDIANDSSIGNGGGVSGEWESHTRRELADHEVQAERLRQRLESQRLRRLEESKARRDRQQQQQQLNESASYSTSNGDSWETRQRLAERRRREERRQAEEASASVLQDSATKLTSASRTKSSQEAEEQLRRHRQLKRREQAHRDRSEEMRRSARRESANARRASERRSQSATRNRELVQEKKQMSLREQQLMQLERFRSSAERRKRLEAEIDEYKEELRRYRQLAEQRAEELVNRRSQQLARRAAAKEAQRQSVARRNQHEQERSEAAWRQQTALKSAARLDEAARQAEARERERQNARALAETAARLRASVRRGSDTFDKKVAQVNLVNQLGLGHEIK